MFHWRFAAVVLDWIRESWLKAGAFFSPSFPWGVRFVISLKLLTSVIVVISFQKG